jgi:phosphate butyryltransferase
VAQAADAEVIQAIADAQKLGLCDPILVGDSDAIKLAANEVGYDLSKAEVVPVTDKIEAGREAVRLVSSGYASTLMKGLLNTADLLRAVLDKEIGLRTGKLLSHVAVLDVPSHDRLLLMTDGGMNMYPNVQQKAQMIRNAVEVAHALGDPEPKVAALAALELVNPEMPATVDAAELTRMNRDGEITGCIVEGPIALDGAISADSYKHKGIKNPIAGQANVLLVPYIEVGNVLYKALVFMAGARVAGIVVGARAPIVLTSRADTHEAKVYSIATAAVLAQKAGI